jgi:predicted nucleic-acid-binding Zn-ribbon protein
MIRPLPSKFTCPKCGYSKIHQPESDALSPMDLVQICPKCNKTMQKTDKMSAVDVVVGKFKSLFDNQPFNF